MLILVELLTADLQSWQAAVSFDPWALTHLIAHFLYLFVCLMVDYLFTW